MLTEVKMETGNLTGFWQEWQIEWWFHFLKWED